MSNIEWIPVRKRTPELNDLVLATVRNEETGQKHVCSCKYGELINAETGEIINTFYFQTGRYTIDVDDRRTFKTLAWAYIPNAYVDDFKVIICGSRTFSDYEFMKTKLDKIFSGRKPTAIICGEAMGADICGKKYALKHNIEVKSYPADWDKYGKQAGYLRNEQMAEVADACIAFWDGKSSGTKHMIETAKKKGLQVRVVNYAK